MVTSLPSAQKHHMAGQGRFGASVRAVVAVPHLASHTSAAGPPAIGKIELERGERGGWV